MQLTDKIITAYIVTIFTLGFFLAFATPLLWPDQERTVTCTAGNHPVSSLMAWNMDNSLTGKYHWVCDEHLRLIYPRTVGK